jgi:hypothetical protein
MPTEDEIKKIPVETTPKEKEEVVDAEKEAAKKMFPFMLRITHNSTHKCGSHCLHPKIILTREK